MTEHNFRHFLSRHHAVHLKYKANGQAGLINIWFYRDRFVLTWEECKDGDQSNEGSYSHDEVHNFSDIDAVVTFLNVTGVDIRQFSV